MNEVKKFGELGHQKNTAKTLLNKGFNHGYDSDFRQKHKTVQYIKPYEYPKKERYELRCVTKALSGLPHGSSVLLWPCGCSQLLPLLKKLGHNVTSADSLPDAVNRIRLFGGLLGTNCIDDKDCFKVVDIYQKGFDDDYFGAAVINQLFTCLPVAQIRQMIFRELRRICTGPIIVSLFCNTMIYKIKRNKRQGSHIVEERHDFSLSRKALTEEVQKCGLAVEKWIPKFGFRTMQACVVLVRNKGS